MAHHMETSNQPAFIVYEHYSGQKINAQKSVITFGSRVFGATQHRLKSVLGISNQGGGGKYIGLPEQFGRKKKEMFEYIIERVKKRSTNWSAKFLSPAGKEIMIKSVALAMPVYAMSCFKLTQSIISEIETLLMNFWWEKSSNQRGIPWIAWKKLQYSKKEGGLGFRDLAKFNDALLAKQAWRIIQHPQSLFARVITARYFKGETILDARAKKQQSYGWSSLLSGIALLKKGTRYLVGDGKTIRVGIDNFVDSHPPRPLVTEPRNAEMTMKNLFHVNNIFRSWDARKVDVVVDTSDHAHIFNTYLSKELKPDKLIWNYNPSGDYTVRSGYWFLTHDPHNIINQANRPHVSTELKNKIWCLPLMPKIKHILWRMLSRALATTERLTTRGMNIDPTCPRCGRCNESINHALFTCHSFIVIWRLSNSSIGSPHSMSDNLEDNFTNILNSLQNNLMRDIQKLLPFWLLWRIWKSRNNLVFNKFRESVSKTVLLAQAETKEWIELTKKQSRVPAGQRRSSPVINVWKAPPQHIVKCNFDAGFNIHNLQATGGWIIRDYRGFPKCWGALVLGHAGSPLEAETKVLLAALQQAWIRGFTKVVFEGDCELLITLVNESSGNNSLANLLLDICLWASKFSYIQFSFVKTEGSTAAHNLAKFGCVSSSFYAESVSQPLRLEKQICNDIIQLI